LNLIVLLSILACSRIKENPDVTENELISHVKFLASDSLKGRYPGTREDSVAATYIANEFRKAGLKWVTENGLQEFEVITHREMGKNNTFQMDNFTGTPGKDFVPAPFSSNNSVDAEVVFCGYGFEIDDKDLKWNDFMGVDISGKWVMVLRGNPLPDQSVSIYDSYSNDRDKAMVAMDNGASGIIYVSGPLFDPYDELMTLKSMESPVGIPAIHISRNLADMILKPSGNSVEDLEKGQLKLSPLKQKHIMLQVLLKVPIL
jgi:PA domain